MARGRRSTRAAAVETLEGRALHATVVVQNTGPWGFGTLAQAMLEAKPGDTVDARGIEGTINLEFVLPVNKDVTVVGPGSGKLRLTSGHVSRAFEVTAGTDFTLSGVTLDHCGRSDYPGTAAVYYLGYDGGAIRVDGGLDDPAGPARLTLRDVVLSNNTAFLTGGALQAAYADVTLTDCRFTNNRVVAPASATGGGLYLVGGSLDATGTTFDHNAVVSTRPGDDRADTVGSIGGGLALMNVGKSGMTNCTIAANTLEATPGLLTSDATNMGAGLLLVGDGDFTMTHCTVAGNVCVDTSGVLNVGGGVAVLAFAADAFEGNDTLTVQNSVIADNYAGVGRDAFGLDVTGTGRSVLQNNVLGVGDDSGVTDGVNGNAAGTAFLPLDARLDALADNGGPTPTMMPRDGSPAIGRATAGVPKRDQLGRTRGDASAAGAVAYGDDFAPDVTVAPTAAAASDRRYTATLTTSVARGDPGDVTITPVSLPKWLSVTDNGDGTATLSGVPDAASVGDATFTLRLTNGKASVRRTFNLSVALTPALMTSGGVLKVSGGVGDDAVHVWQPRGTGMPVRVMVGRRVRNYPLAGIRGITINTLGGDDSVLANPLDFGVYIDSGDGNDTVVGSDNNDTLAGGNGDDNISGLGGNDRVSGNNGRDTLDGGVGNDRLYGDSGRDRLDGNRGRDTLTGGAGPDAFLSNDGTRDYLYGDASHRGGGVFDRRDVVRDVLGNDE